MRKQIKKFLIIFLLLSFMLIGCASSKNDSNRSDLTISYKSGAFWDKNWDSDIGTYTGVAIPNEECAIAVASAIYNAIPGEDDEGRVPTGVFFDEEEEIWIVSFGRLPYNGVYFLGGDCSIALRKADGQVVRIWFGE